MNMREKIARAMAHADGLDPDYEMEGARRFPSGTPIFKHPMYQKYADTVLDALMEPTWEMEGAGIQTDEIDSIDWVGALMDTGITSAQVVVVASYKAMIKAAKEGK